MNKKMTLIKKAKLGASLWHFGQTRKYSGDAYVTHPIRVAARVAIQTDDEYVIAAAFLHDTLEDTEATFDDLVKHYGLRVALIVKELTDVFTPENYPDQNRAWRKRQEAYRLGRASEDAKLIKRADIADNTESIEREDPNFAKVYLAEKAFLLAEMDRG